MIALPIAHDPFAEGVPPAPYLVPLPTGFDPFAQATPDAASTSAATPASPPPPPWILARVHHDPFRGPPSAPYLVSLPLGYDPFAGSDAEALNPSASSSPSPTNADTPVTDTMTPAYAMAPAIQDRPPAADAGGLRSNPPTSVADAPWWLDQYNAALPNATRVNPDPAAPVAADFDANQLLKAWLSNDPYMREGVYAADQAAAAKLRRPDLPGLAQYVAHPETVAAREAGLGGIAAPADRDSSSQAAGADLVSGIGEAAPLLEPARLAENPLYLAAVPALAAERMSMPPEQRAQLDGQFQKLNEADARDYAAWRTRLANDPYWSVPSTGSWNFDRILGLGGEERVPTLPENILTSVLSSGARLSQASTDPDFHPEDPDWLASPKGQQYIADSLNVVGALAGGGLLRARSRAGRGTLGTWGGDISRAIVERSPNLSAESKQLVQDYLGLGPNEFDGKVSIGPDQVTVAGKIIQDGKVVATIDRGFKPGTTAAYHEDLDVKPWAQGQGLSKRILSANMRFYEAHGFERIETMAIDAGAYTWARYGFVPDAEWWPRLVKQIEPNLEQARIDGLPEEAYKDVMTLLESRNPRAIWQIADARTPVNGVPLGEKLLNGTEWHGSFSLNDPEMMERFRNYVATPSRRGRQP
jgi:hypothetical protein